ncbi:CAP domain-containing protein [bacterium]|nr:CAP domain-containing protein [bacterium]
MKKKKILTITTIIVIVLLGIILFIFLEKKDIKEKESSNIQTNEEKINIKENVEVEINSEVLNIKNFFENSNFSDGEINYFESDKKIKFDTKYNKIGSFKVVIKINDKNYETTLNVVDKLAPTLKLKELTITLGDKFEINSFVESCTDNSEEDCILSYKENKKYTKVGTYDVTIIAKDKSDNVVEETTKLIIKNKKNTNETQTKNDNKTNNNSNKVKFVKEETESVKETKELKYGTILNSWHVKTYKLYSDESKKIVNEYTHYEVDGTNFNAKTSDMLPEAIENMNVYKDIVNDVVKYTNEFRTEVGQAPLTLDETLTKAAMVRAIEMAYSDKFSHERPDGNMCYYIMRDFGQDIYGVGENIASRQRNAKEVSYAWKGSQGHYENMISASFTRIGVGVINFYGTYYWVQLFQY